MSMTDSPFCFCPRCGSRLFLGKIGGRERPVCPSGHFVYYRNPAVGVAVILLEGDRVLLVRRARGATKGAWCIPCGYVEWEEEIRRAAAREMHEETGLEVEVGPVYAVHSNFHDPQAHSVGVWFTGRIVGGKMTPADDVDAAQYFPLEELPENLAFPTDREVLARLADESKRRQGVSR